DVSTCAVGDVIPVITTPRRTGEVNGITLPRREPVVRILRGYRELLSNFAFTKSGNFPSRNQHFIGAAGSTGIAGTKDGVRNKPWLGARCSRRIFRRLGNGFHPDVCGLKPNSPGKVRILTGLGIIWNTSISIIDYTVTDYLI